MQDQFDSLISFSKQAHDACLEISLALFERTKGEIINELIFVPTTILTSIIRQHEAIELLLKNGYPSEAAIVCLSLFELKLDIMFIDHDVKKAAKWLEHESDYRHPWPVRNKIEHIYGEGTAEAVRHKSMFKLLSSIKHGNPKSREFGFSVRRSGKTIIVSTSTVDDQFSKIFSCMTLTYSTQQLLEAMAAVRGLISRYFGSTRDADLRLAELIKTSTANMADVFKLIKKEEK